jgi:hypothetical protein
MRVDSMLSDVHLAHPITMGLIPKLSTFGNRRLDTRYGMAYTLGMTNERTNLDTNDHTLEGEIRDYPARFPSRAAWDRYCEDQANRTDEMTREIDTPW